MPPKLAACRQHDGQTVEKLRAQPAVVTRVEEARTPEFEVRCIGVWADPRIDQQGAVPSQPRRRVRVRAAVPATNDLLGRPGGAGDRRDQRH